MNDESEIKDKLKTKIKDGKLILETKTVKTRDGKVAGTVTHSVKVGKFAEVFGNDFAGNATGRAARLKAKDGGTKGYKKFIDQWVTEGLIA